MCNRIRIDAETVSDEDTFNTQSAESRADFRRRTILLVGKRLETRGITLSRYFSKRMFFGRRYRTSL